MELNDINTIEIECSEKLNDILDEYVDKLTVVQIVGILECLKMSVQTAQMIGHKLKEVEE